MSTLLAWQGPFGFTSHSAQPLLTASAGADAGVYFWAVRTVDGPRAHYVGEAGGSFAARHVEHFRAYASGIYNTRDADALAGGNDVILNEGALWRRRPPAAAQRFIDNFECFAHHTVRSINLIDIYVAAIECDQRTRRRLEGGLVTALYAAPPEMLRLFPPGYRVWRRNPVESPLLVQCDNPPDVPGFPTRFEA